MFVKNKKAKTIGMNFVWNDVYEKRAISWDKCD